MPVFFLHASVPVQAGPLPGPAELALADFLSDWAKVFGAPPKLAASSDSAAFRVRLDPTLTNDAEAWTLDVGPTGPTLRAGGALGLVYGLYAFAEHHLGVDPLWFWKDVPPRRRDRVAVPHGVTRSTRPVFRWRGWFINDEDLLTGFGAGGGRRAIDYPFYARVIDPAVADRIFEAVLRCGGNLVIPASFLDIANPSEAALAARAAARGLHVSQHHIEALGVSHFAYENHWLHAEGAARPLRYVAEPDRVRAVWRHHARLWRQTCGDRVVWQLGLRGRGDSPVWHADPDISRETGGRHISAALADQVAIIREVDPRPHPPMTMTLFLEGADLMAAGELTIPEGVTIVFSDRGETQEMQADFHRCAREPGCTRGAYYHAAFWRKGPHLCPGADPARVARVLGQLVARGDTDYLVVNVSNLREHTLGAFTSLRLARDGASPEVLERTLAAYAPPEVRPLVQAYVAALAVKRDGSLMQDGDCIEAVVQLVEPPPWLDGRFEPPEWIDAATLREGAHRFDQVARAADAAAGRVPPEWRAFTALHVGVMARQMAALYRAVAALLRPDYPDYAAAADEIAAMLAVRRPLAAGRWQGWHDGDHKADWPRLHRLLAARAAALVTTF
jgi:hypothetical protein